MCVGEIPQATKEEAFVEKDTVNARTWYLRSSRTSHVGVLVRHAEFAAWRSSGAVGNRRILVLSLLRRRQTDGDASE